ncbi:MAG: helicase-related protein [Thermoplasmatales archaeon]|nr:helicase-related protein [Thermoplasmatales archaeon]
MPKYSELLRDDLIEFREYQDSIALKAVERNTLIVIPTALGKTIIAIIALSILIEDGGKCIFLAPTRPLVHQHAASIRKFLNLQEHEIVEVTGEIKKSLRQELYYSARVIVSTPQVIGNDSALFNDIRRDVKVVIFDEAHRAIGNYSYVEVANFFADSRIIAMTASPGGDREKIDQIIKNLRIVDLEIRDENSPDVVEYIKGIDVEQVKITAPPGVIEIIEQLKEMLGEMINKLESFSLKVQGHSRKELISLGDYIFSQIKRGNKYFYSAVRIRTYAILTDYLLEFAETQGVLPFYEYLQEMKKENSKAKKIVTDPRMIAVEKKAEKLSNEPLNLHTPKISKIIEILKEGNKEKAIVFCHYRITANILSEILKKEGFSCEKFIGQSSKRDSKGMSQKEQTSTLQLFREGQIKVLVATQVGEEGLDVPAADTVIFYEPVASEVRSIQRRGRTGRFGKGKVYVLTMENTRDLSYYYSAGRKEKKMKNILREGKKNVQTTFDTFN